MKNKKNINKILILIFATLIILNTKVFGADISKFDLRDQISLNIKDQKSSTECWALSMTTVFESNLSLKIGENREISARQIDYAASKSFKNMKNYQNIYNREVNTGGIAELALGIMTNGRGPVAEGTMPFSETFGDIVLEDFNKNKNIYQVNDWVEFPNIYKKKENGEIIYKGPKCVIYSNTYINEIRNKIKQHIMRNGAVTGVTNIAKWNECYNQDTKAYYYSWENEEKIQPDHSMTIIGWDDNYSKDNFKGIKPQKNGAYLVQTSWGNDGMLDRGTYYVSYEDKFIEQEIYGIEEIKEKDYDKIYQYDELGRNQYLKGGFLNTICGANVFNRTASEEEYLTSIGVSTYCNMKYEVYINSEDGEISSKKLKKIETIDEVLTPGYHTINIQQPVKLTGNKFVVLIVYIGVDGELCVTTEAANSELHANATGNAGESYIGLFLDFMEDINSKFKNTNICIKAFTNVVTESSDGTVTAKTYQISGDKSIYKIKPETMLEKFNKNIILPKKFAVYKNTNPIIDATQYISTGMLMKLEDNTEYRLIVEGDLNKDGKLTTTDISQLKMQLIRLRELDEISKKAADINIDNKITPVDFSRMKGLITKLIV